MDSANNSVGKIKNGYRTNKQHGVCLKHSSRGNAFNGTINCVCSFYHLSIHGACDDMTAWIETFASSN